MGAENGPAGWDASDRVHNAVEKGEPSGEVPIIDAAPVSGEVPVLDEKRVKQAEAELERRRLVEQGNDPSDPAA